MPRIFDNNALINLQNSDRDTDAQLGTYLQNLLRGHKRMDIATGYFNLRGWKLFCDIIDAKHDENPPERVLPIARILIGMVSKSDHDEIMQSYADELAGEECTTDITRAKKGKEKLLQILRDQLTGGIPTLGDRKTLRQLYSQVEQGTVQLKVYCRQPLHGKTYILHRDDCSTPITAVVGSSNLTYPGLMTNLELNTDVTDADASRKLSDWFEQLWDDKFSLDIKPELLSLLDESWAAPQGHSPYEIYLKLCYDLSEDARQGLTQFELVGPIKEELLDFQLTAVKTLGRRILTRGGTMLGDVVGLGKTITATAVALMLRDEGLGEPLVICPKNLEEMWTGYFESYDLHGEIVPYSMAKKLDNLRRHQFVIIDESHTLRNSSRRDYELIRDYIQRNDSKVLLLTATPYNVDFENVANQLALFLDEDKDLGIQPTVALSDPVFAGNLDCGKSTLRAFRRSTEPEDWKRLMGEHLIRRTRSFVRKQYCEMDENGREYLTMRGGERFYFPNRSPRPINHEFTHDDPALKMTSDRTLDVISRLKLPRYSYSEYLNPYEISHLTESEQEAVNDWKQSRGQARGFLKIGFYKRLSSCGYSFITSLIRHLQLNKLFLYALEHQLDLPTGTVFLYTDKEEEPSTPVDYGSMPFEDIYSRLQNENPSGIRWIRSSIFSAQFEQDLRTDIEAIEELINDFGPWEIKHDSKLLALVKLINEDHPLEKLLIFTEYKDTAQYLAASLQELGVQSFGVVTGDTTDPTSVAAQFSPNSNKVSPDHEIRVLIATDVLSEGQNLQDSHIVVNFDIPWAIIKLIQRAGRVDRLGQRSDEVLIYTITHGGIEDILELRKRVQHRLQQNATTFGSDDSFFDSNYETQLLEGLYSGRLDDPEDDEVDALSHAYEVWSRAEKENPKLADRVKRLPDQIDATRRAHSDEKDMVVVHVRTTSGIDSFALKNSEGEQLLTAQEALRRFECEPSSLSRPRLKCHDEWVASLVKGSESILRQQSEFAGQLRGVRKRIWDRFRNTLQSSPQDEALDAVFSSPLTKNADLILRQAFRNGKSDEELLALLTQLHCDDKLIVPPNSTDPIRLVTVMGANHE